MSSRTKSVAVVIIFFSIIVAWLAWRTDWDARAIHGRLSELAELVEKDGAESTIEVLGRARKLADFFTEDMLVEYLPNRPVLRDRDAMSAAFVNLRSSIDRASIDLSGHEIQVGPQGEEAESTVRATAEVSFSGGRSEDSGKREYRIDWMKTEGAWRIRHVRLLGPN